MAGFYIYLIYTCFFFKFRFHIANVLSSVSLMNDGFVFFTVSSSMYVKVILMFAKRLYMLLTFLYLNVPLVISYY